MIAPQGWPSGASEVTQRSCCRPSTICGRRATCQLGAAKQHRGPEPAISARNCLRSRSRTPGLKRARAQDPIVLPDAAGRQVDPGGASACARIQVRTSDTIAARFALAPDGLDRVGRCRRPRPPTARLRPSRRSHGAPPSAGAVPSVPPSIERRMVPGLPTTNTSDPSSHTRSTRRGRPSGATPWPAQLRPRSVDRTMAPQS